MVSEKKVKELEKIKNYLQKYKNIIIVDLSNTPNSIYKKVQEELKKLDSILTVVKKRIFLKAFNKEIKVPDNMAIIFTNESITEIYKKISKMKVYRFATANDISPKDIWIKAGPTELPPGPLISELSKVGLKVGVEKGKIAVKEDFLLVKKGEKISAEKASVLQKFNIKPIEVKLKVYNAIENGYNLTYEHLKLMDDLENELKNAIKNVFNLSININYPTIYNINFLISKTILNIKAISNLLKI